MFQSLKPLDEFSHHQFAIVYSAEGFCQWLVSAKTLQLKFSHCTSLKDDKFLFEKLKQLSIQCLVNIYNAAD